MSPGPTPVLRRWESAAATWPMDPRHPCGLIARASSTMSGSRWHGCAGPRRPPDRSRAMAQIDGARSPYVIGVGIEVGIGRLTGRPSTSALAHRPAALSTPFRLRIIFTRHPPPYAASQLLLSATRNYLGSILGTDTRIGDPAFDCVYVRGHTAILISHRVTSAAQLSSMPRHRQYPCSPLWRTVSRPTIPRAVRFGGSYGQN